MKQEKKENLLLSQSDCDRLLGLRKYALDTTATFPFPVRGDRDLSIDLRSDDPAEKFLLDCGHNRIYLYAYKVQLRGRKTIPLARIDLGETKEHVNPDGTRLLGSHIHLYSEQYQMRVAKALPLELDEVADRQPLVVERFLDFCNIVDKPHFEYGLG